MKDWIARMRAGLREVTQSMRTGIARLSKAALHRIARGWNYLGTKTIRVWLWTFAAIAAYVIFSFYVYSALLSADTRIDELSFWDTNPEDARNLILVIGGWLGVLAAIVGFVLAGFRTSTQMQMTQTAIDGQVTERFTRAVEQLGHEKRAVRLGAIYALERIAKDSDRDRDTIVETLAAYIREMAPYWSPHDKKDPIWQGAEIDSDANLAYPRPAIDIEAALTVICRMMPADDPIREKLDLRYTDLRGLNAPGINLSGIRLVGANLSKANLSEADLSRADLAVAWLLNTNLTRAILNQTVLVLTGLSDANLLEAKGLTQEQLSAISRVNIPPRNLPDGLTLPEPYDP
ncbi:MAG: pentapeptide repeat-containing protein [Alphaproteobacteria bacterium]